ncbi:MAG TPA: hypothetical protein DCE42_11085 [Myxococcales bacterium]|nr:hypothetical protein [Deltaproteobacteria bacterium]MBU52391.1 hypothetical protein [Deltaproteobacteria bacterium]HAA55292.1 hypothetical protein [Myxococcales bacterium]|tara:strand:+ start:5284 stop:6252 length:969 start_codon:yes stop_codon:yes gene_type:complete
MFVLVWWKVLPLFLAMGMGYLSGALKVFPRPADAVDVLNRYALYFGFPLLIFQGFCRPSLVLSSNPGFYVFHVLMAAMIVGGIVWVGGWFQATRGVRGGLVLGTLFGNVAYLGMPLSIQILGSSYLGWIALSVTLQVFFSMALGPLALVMLRESGRGDKEERRRLLRKLVRQPLLWAPVLGFLVRFSLPAQTLQGIATPLSFFASSAAPVALFLLGLHIWNHQHTLRRIRVDVWGMLLCKLCLVPLMAFALGWCFVKWGWMARQEWRVVLVLSFMPTAITTFSIAKDFRENEDLMAQAILLSTLITLLALPLLIPFVVQWTS